MLYFYGKAREIEKKILDTTEFPKEVFWLRSSVPLPDLGGTPPPA